MGKSEQSGDGNKLKLISLSAEMIWLLLLTTLLGLHQVHSASTCIGEHGQPVDMFILYKLPRVKSHPDPYISDGYGYIYLDSLNPSFRLGRTVITDEETAVARTLNQVYLHDQEKDDLVYALYSDQPPKTKRSYGSYAHAKGAIAFDKTSGFWLIHSVPRFAPKVKYGYGYPKSR